MPLSFGTTPSQVSLFRHIADPKQVSQDKLRDLKLKSNKRSKTQSYYDDQSAASANPKSFAPPQSFARSFAANQRSFAGNQRSFAGNQRSFAGNQRSFATEPQNFATIQENDEESVALGGNEDDGDDQAKEQEGNSFEQEAPSYEAEKSQVQDLVQDEVDREKEHFLAELRKYRGQTTREFTMQDSLTDIQFEYDRLKGPENAANVVRIMGIVLQVVVYAVQWANGKFGPLLKLDNGETSWAMQTAESISNHEYNNVLEKLYRKHWRKGSMSPEAELGMMLIGSAGVFHFQTHVNEKLTKKTAERRGSGGSSSGGGFNLMDLVGPVMGLMGGAGAQKQAFVPPPPPSGITEKKSPGFDFVAGRRMTESGPMATSGPLPATPAPALAPPLQTGPSLVEMEQQFAKRQQEMINRMDEITRRADEQMRASQARQLDLERQLQQTQMKLQQVQHQSVHQTPQQQQQQQQQQFFSHQNMQQVYRHPMQPGTMQTANMQQAQRVDQTKIVQQPQQHQQPQRIAAGAPGPVLRELAFETASPDASPPMSPLSPVQEQEGGQPSDGEEEVKCDVKEVMVTERQKRKKTPVQLEIDELSLAL